MLFLITCESVVAIQVIFLLHLIGCQFKVKDVVVFSNVCCIG